MAKIDNLTIQLQADPSPFVKALEQGRAILDQFRRSIPTRYIIQDHVAYVEKLDPELVD